jgi:hypothetical protein
LGLYVLPIVKDKYESPIDFGVPVIL